MSEMSFLDGRVSKRTLPAMSPQPEAPQLKRLLLPQGELAQFHDGAEPIRYLAYIELRPGLPRGNHYHKIKQEYIYVISGEMTLFVQEVNSGSNASIPLCGGDLVFIETGVAHTLKPLAPGHAIEFSAAPFEAADIFRFPLDLT